MPDTISETCPLAWIQSHSERKISISVQFRCIPKFRCTPIFCDLCNISVKSGIKKGVPLNSDKNLAERLLIGHIVTDGRGAEDRLRSSRD